MSTLVDPQFPRRNPEENGDLAIIPNIYDPQRPLPVMVTQDKLPKLYELFFGEEWVKQQQQQAAARQAEESALYGGSTNAVTAQW